MRDEQRYWVDRFPPCRPASRFKRPLILFFCFFFSNLVSVVEPSEVFLYSKLIPDVFQQTYCSSWEKILGSFLEPYQITATQVLTGSVMFCQVYRQTRLHRMESPLIWGFPFQWATHFRCCPWSALLESGRATDAEDRHWEDRHQRVKDTASTPQAHLMSKIGTWKVNQRYGLGRTQGYLPKKSPEMALRYPQGCPLEQCNDPMVGPVARPEEPSRRKTDWLIPLTDPTTRVEFVLQHFRHDAGTTPVWATRVLGTTAGTLPVSWEAECPLQDSKSFGVLLFVLAPRSAHSGASPSQTCFFVLKMERTSFVSVSLSIIQEIQYSPFPMLGTAHFLSTHLLSF